MTGELDRFEWDGGKLILGDCREMTIEADLCLTDPPYGISHPCSFAKRGRGERWACHDWPDVEGDNEPFSPHPFLRYEKCVLWGANHFSSKLPDSGGWLVWDKERPDGLDQATCELAWTNCVKGVRRFRHLWNGLCRDSEIGEHLHPTQKPVALMQWVLNLPWVCDAETVFDPYMGSCPVGIACIRTGRKFIGIEISPEYFKTAVERVKRELAQPMLIPPAMHAPQPERLLL